jgi:dipeptidyl-peptidase 4
MSNHASRSDQTVSFPRQQARTRRFTLGAPRGFRIAGDGSRVAFLRSAAGDDPINALWVFDLETGTERLVANPRSMSQASGDVPDEELARRERVRESAEGIVAYATDLDARRACFALGGALFVADLTGGEVRSVSTAGPVIDPRLDPTGARVAYVTGGSLHVVELDGTDGLLAGDNDPDVTWGLAEFVAAEEMGRTRGFWWSPDGTVLVAARVDDRTVGRWHVSNPSDPSHLPREIRYPAAGTANADVTLTAFELQGKRTDLPWARDELPYLARVVWKRGAPLTLLVQSRDQRRTQVLEADPSTGETGPLLEDEDEAWLEIVDGTPDWLDDGRLVMTAELDDTRRLFFDEQPMTPTGMPVRAVLDCGDGAVFSASKEPTESHLWSVSSGGELVELTQTPGVHSGVVGGNVMVVVSANLDEPGATTEVWRGGERVGRIGSFAERPSVTPNVSLRSLGRRELRSALLFPADGGGRKLPVLLDPYGGPHAQRVVKAHGAFLASQWFADQGFAVLVADGRGTPGRGHAWERAVRGDLATVTLEDQVDALHAAAGQDDRLDLTRVGIRGWSFGGYLAALAVLRRPDVFHAAVAGAPVTDWRLYDTHYTERYLGDPNEDREAYARSSLLDEASKLERPLLLIHGLADDNVVVAHTLQLSRALLEAGRTHSVLPLSGVTHMTPQEAVAENLLLLQVEFLKRALGM